MQYLHISSYFIMLPKLRKGGSINNLLISDFKMADNEQKAVQLCAEAEKKMNAKPFLGKLSKPF